MIIWEFYSSEEYILLWKIWSQSSMQVDRHSDKRNKIVVIIQIANLQSQWKMNNVEIDIVQLKIFQWLFQRWLDQLRTKGRGPNLLGLNKGSCGKWMLHVILFDLFHLITRHYYWLERDHYGKKFHFFLSSTVYLTYPCKLHYLIEFIICTSFTMEWNESRYK